MFWLEQFKKDFLWGFSYKISFFGQFFGIFLTVFTFFFISKTFETSSSHHLDQYGNNYFLFAIIGIGTADLINLSLRSATSSIRDAQAFGYIDALLNSKIDFYYIILCSMIYPCSIGIVKIFMYFTIASFLTEFQISFLMTIAIFFLCILSFIPFLGLALISGSFVLFFKQGDPINFLITLIISIFSGVVFPISVLPDQLRFFSELIPLTYSLEIIRKVAIYNSLDSIIFKDILFISVIGLLILFLGILTIKNVAFKVKLQGTSGSY